MPHYMKLQFHNKIKMIKDECGKTAKECPVELLIYEAEQRHLMKIATPTTFAGYLLLDEAFALLKQQLASPADKQHVVQNMSPDG